MPPEGAEVKHIEIEGEPARSFSFMCRIHSVIKTHLSMMEHLQELMEKDGDFKDNQQWLYGQNALMEAREVFAMCDEVIENAVAGFIAKEEEKKDDQA